MNELFGPLFHRFTEQSAWGTLLALLLLVAGVSFLFAGKDVGRFYLGLLRALWRLIRAPFVFVRRYALLSHDSGPEEAYALTATRAPLSVAVLTWMNVMVAFSGILVLALTLLLTGKAAMPDPEVSGALAFYEQTRPMAVEDMENSKSLQDMILQGQGLDQLGRNRLYQQIRERRITLLKAQGEKIEKLFLSDSEASKAWEELKMGKVSDMMRARNDWELNYVSFYPGLRARKDLEPLYRRLVELRAIIEVQIARNRIFRPSESPWENDSQLYRERELWSRVVSTAEQRVTGIENETKRLEPVSGVQWKAAAKAFAGGLVAFIAWIWAYGLIVEAANLILGHLEALRKVREIMERQPGSLAGAVISPEATTNRQVSAEPKPPVVRHQELPPSFEKSPSLLPQLQVCIRCGTQLEIGAGFCGNCGSRQA